MNKYFLLIILSSLIALQAKAEDSVSSDLEEVNVFESLKKTGDLQGSSSSEVKMSASEEQDDLQSLKEDIGDIVFEKNGSISGETKNQKAEDKFSAK